MDWKTPLMEYAQKHGKDVTYSADGSGPDHARIFDASVFLGDELFGFATSSSKRHAENLAAKEALLKLGLV
jgi:dsRNA-specific ribonuclease